jgi:hypothetical protein
MLWSHMSECGEPLEWTAGINTRINRGQDTTANNVDGGNQSRVPPYHNRHVLSRPFVFWSMNEETYQLMRI